MERVRLARLQEVFKISSGQPRPTKPNVEHQYLDMTHTVANKTRAHLQPPADEKMNVCNIVPAPE